MLRHDESVIHVLGRRCAAVCSANELCVIYVFVSGALVVSPVCGVGVIPVSSVVVSPVSGASVSPVSGVVAHGVWLPSHVSGVLLSFGCSRGASVSPVCRALKSRTCVDDLPWAVCSSLSCW